NRGDSLLLVGMSGGLHIASALTTPATLAVYLGESVLIGVESGSASSSQDDAEGEAEATYTNQGIYLRYFMGNSFNILVAANNRTWTADATVTQTTVTWTGTTTETVTADLEASATIGTLGIGNQWLTDFGFTLGIDWIVGSGILGSSVSSNIKTTTTTDPAEMAQFQQDLEDFGEFLNLVSALPGFFVVTIGFTF
ncbi:MAG: hypothetical protein GY866_10770, partial [Proteobacteria bacterium]|nr:hypothetical protein [Pseudomonadota bacterium]